MDDKISLQSTEEKNATFRSREKEQYSFARRNRKRGIKRAKAAYRKRIEDQFTNRDPTQVWQDIKYLTNNRTKKDPPIDSNVLLAKELNHYFSRFKVKEPHNTTTLYVKMAAGPDDM